MTDHVRAGIVGVRFMGTVHARAIRRAGGVVSRVVGSTPESSRAAAEQLGAENPSTTVEELLAADDVDVVHICTPNATHAGLARAAIAAGKHVVCEKPLAMTAAESAGLVESAARSGLVNAVNFNIRFYPLNQHLREEVAAGALGDVRFVTGHYFQDWLLHDTDWNWRLEPDKGGSLRAVGDIGSHWLDLTSFITGQPIVAVMADLATFVGARQEPRGPVETFATERSTDAVTRPVSTEDVATILLRFANGARGAVAISQISAGRKNSLRYEIDGSDAAAAWDSERPEELWLGHRDRPNELLLRNPSLMGPAGRAAAALPGGHVEGFGDTFGALFRAIYADIAAGGPAARPPYATFADGHDEMLVNDAIAESARLSRWVSVARPGSSPSASGPTLAGATR